MHHVSSPQNKAAVIDRWWHDCSMAACVLPKEQTAEWLELISQVVRYYRLMEQCPSQADQKHYRKLCQHALAKSKWELMLLSIYGHISKKEIKSLEELQSDLEKALKG